MSRGQVLFIKQDTTGQDIETGAIVPLAWGFYPADAVRIEDDGRVFVFTVSRDDAKQELVGGPVFVPVLGRPDPRWYHVLAHRIEWCSQVLRDEHAAKLGVPPMHATVDPILVTREASVVRLDHPSDRRVQVTLELDSCEAGVPMLGLMFGMNLILSAPREKYEQQHARASRSRR